MTEIRSLTEKFAVASQPVAEDFKTFAAAGFTTIVCNRPDGEADQISSIDAANLAKAAGLTYVYLPFQGPPPADVVAKLADIIKTSNGPILAHCKSGTRSAMAWALASAQLGRMAPDAILETAAKAGYDLSGLSPRLMVAAD